MSKALSQRLSRPLYWLGGLLLVIWIIQLINALTGYWLVGQFGLIPRHLSGADGILLMPFLHGSLAHISSNSVPLIVLGALLATSARPIALPASALIIVISGIGVWLLGSQGIHVGASGLIFGWFTLLVARGLIERKPLEILIALAVGVFYGAMLWGVLPGTDGVSWEAHLFGALAGVGSAYWLRRREAA